MAIQIIEGFSKTEIAVRYYKQVAPERNYPKEQARKQLDQDSNIDFKLLEKIIDDLTAEQKAVFKKNARATK